MEAAAHDPVVTVVIPTYNRSSSVGSALASVLAQQGPPFEVVVVDDGSTDGTAEMLSAHIDPRVRVIAALHGGVCAARNRGAAEARGTWLAFLDSDDSVEPGWLAALLATADAGSPLVTCAATLRYPDGTVRTPAPAALGRAFGSITAHFLAGTFLVTAELFGEVGGYLGGLTYAENTELGMRLGAEIERRGLRAGVVMESFVEVAADHRPYDAERYYSSGAAILERSGALLQRDPHLWSMYLAITGVAAGRSGRTAEARRLLGRAWRTEPLVVRHAVRLVRSQLPIRSLR